MDLETTRTEMKKEAIVRMKILKLYDKVIEEFEKENKLNKSETSLGSLYWLNDKEKEMVKEYEKNNNVLVYHVIKSITSEMGVVYDLLFITEDESLWEEERKD